MPERLDKILCSMGEASRSGAARMIRAGLVTVNGVTIRDGAVKVDPDADIVVNGRPLNYRRFVYIMMNKPAGVLCAARDSRVRTVLGLLPGELMRPGLFPAGRLDKDTTGLVIITNDGDFAHRMLSPKNEIIKTYRAVLDRPVGQGESDAFEAGLVLADGTRLRPARLRAVETAEPYTVSIEICEGKYHQVKRMAAAVGRRVLSLKRIAIGQLCLDETLAEGDSRKLSEREIGLIFN